jgi:hypothetical protein
MHTEAGIDDRDRGMGVLAADFDKDGRMDIFVANDAQQNTLWHNRGDGAFENVALSWGAAVNARGQTEANMGIAYGDTDSDGNSDLFVTHLVNEHDTLWRAHWAQQTVVFSDETYDAGLGHDSRKFTGWGTAFADFDLDGHLDIVVANGHIRREGNQPFVYENLPLLWHNRGARFANVSDSAGPYFQSLAIARGLAAADLDLDGDMDLVVVHHYERSVVLWNESPRRGASLTVRLRGTGFNRQAIGAQLVARIGERSIVRSIDGGGSYNSANDLQVHFGLGPVTLVDFLQVRWPSGLTTTLERVQVNQHLETAENVSDRDNR